MILQYSVPIAAKHFYETLLADFGKKDNNYITKIFGKKQTNKNFGKWKFHFNDTPCTAD